MLERPLSHYWTSPLNAQDTNSHSTRSLLSFYIHIIDNDTTALSIFKSMFYFNCSTYVNIACDTWNTYICVHYLFSFICCMHNFMFLFIFLFLLSCMSMGNLVYMAGIFFICFLRLLSHISSACSHNLFMHINIIYNCFNWSVFSIW